MKYTGLVDIVRLGSKVCLENADTGFREIGLRLLGKDNRKRILFTMENVKKPKSYSQQNTVFLLVTILYQAMENRKPTNEEKEDLYNDILEAYADRVPTKIGDKTRPIRISESNTVEAGKLIEGLIIELSNYGIKEDLQADVKKIVHAWHAWRGEQDQDPIDAMTTTEKEFRKRNPVCMACLVANDGLQIAHIISRGANGGIRGEPWNLMMLCPEHHGIQHQHGWEEFLRRFPHLKGRWLRAQKMEATDGQG